MRNHVPCCERQHVPDICQDLCRGEYTMQEDRIQSHFSCTAYTEATLMCISQGIGEPCAAWTSAGWGMGGGNMALQF